MESAGQLLINAETVHVRTSTTFPGNAPLPEFSNFRVGRSVLEQNFLGEGSYARVNTSQTRQGSRGNCCWTVFVKSPCFGVKMTGTRYRSRYIMRNLSIYGTYIIDTTPVTFRPASEREARMDDPTRRCENDTGNETHSSGPPIPSGGPIFFSGRFRTKQFERRPSIQSVDL